MPARAGPDADDPCGDQLGSAGDGVCQRQPGDAALHRLLRQGCHATAIAAEALRDWRQWRDRIEAWQRPVLERKSLREPLRMALFNELYDLCSGGTLWSAASPDDPVGRFGVLECLDYAWYESLDVRLYGSLALLQLWPELDKAVLRSFARAIPAADATQRPIGWYFTQGKGRVEADRKVKGATPHDLGAPNEIPWEATNYTAYQDCNLWKDLGSDFVLQVWRTFTLAPSGEDITFLAECWPAAVEALRYLKTFDVNDDGMPDNGGAPDQTFDDWPLKGVSAYCGALWIAALEAALAMAQTLQLPTGLDTSAEQREFSHWLEQSRANFDRLLWNGEYYDIDAESGTPVVMADQLCGDFYARLLGLPPVVSDANSRSTLQAMKKACFEGFAGGFERLRGLEVWTESTSAWPMGDAAARRSVHPRCTDPNGTHPSGWRCGLGIRPVGNGFRARRTTEASHWETRQTAGGSRGRNGCDSQSRNKRRCSEPWSSRSGVEDPCGSGPAALVPDGSASAAPSDPYRRWRDSSERWLIVTQRCFSSLMTCVGLA